MSGHSRPDCRIRLSRPKMLRLGIEGLTAKAVGSHLADYKLSATALTTQQIGGDKLLLGFSEVGNGVIHGCFQDIGKGRL